MKKLLGIILILIACYGFYMFISYLTFDLKNSGDNGLGSYAVWISGWIGLILGIIFLIFGIKMFKSDRQKTDLKN